MSSAKEQMVIFRGRRSFAPKNPPFPKLHQHCTPTGTVSAGLMCKGCGRCPWVLWGCQQAEHSSCTRSTLVLCPSPDRAGTSLCTSPFHPHQNEGQFQDSQFVPVARLTRKWREMSSFGLLENGTLFQNSYTCLIVGLMNTLWSLKYILRYVENICAVSQVLMKIQRNIYNSVNFFCSQMFLTHLKYELLQW